MVLVRSLPPSVVACASGDAIVDLGVFVARGAVATEGVTLSVTGPAIDAAHIELTLARARPFGAKPAPWEAPAWEHTFSIRPGDHRAKVARLRGVHTRQRGAIVSALAVARRPGRSTVTLALETPTERLVRDVCIEVAAAIDVPSRAVRWFRGRDAWRESVSLVEALVAQSLRDGALCVGERLAFRATRSDRDVERVAVRALRSPTTGRRQKIPWALGTIVRRARVGRYATFSVSVEPADLSLDQRGSFGQTQDEPFTVTVSRRRDAEGEWAVCVEIIGTRASPGD